MQLPPRTNIGSLPLVRRMCGSRSQHEPQQGAAVWVLAGLGARGLLFHGWAGKADANGVLRNDEEVIPPELKAWELLD